MKNQKLSKLSMDLYKKKPKTKKNLSHIKIIKTKLFKICKIRRNIK